MPVKLVALFRLARVRILRFALGLLHNMFTGLHLGEGWEGAFFPLETLLPSIEIPIFNRVALPARPCPRDQKSKCISGSLPKT